MNIKNIFSKAFYITWNNPAFWWLGIILLGGFNVQWVLSGTPFPLWISRYQRILEWWLTSGRHFHYPPVWFFITVLVGLSASLHMSSRPVNASPAWDALVMCVESGVKWEPKFLRHSKFGLFCFIIWL